MSFDNIVCEGNKYITFMVRAINHQECLKFDWIFWDNLSKAIFYNKINFIFYDSELN